VPPLPATLRILLVEDHEHVLWGLKKLIDGELPTMVTAASARTFTEALAAMRECMPDVVVTDLFVGGETMPDRFPEFMAIRRVPIVVLTEAREPALHHRAEVCGACAVVTKGDPADRLLDAIRKAGRSAEEGSAA